MFKLQSIDKAIYKQRLNRITMVFIASFALLAVVYGSVLIALFSNSEDNFKYNVLGVILALITCSFIVYKLRATDYFSQVNYLFKLKQVLNKIYAKQHKIEQAATQDDVNALIIMLFYYQGLIQQYQLDDNTLVLSETQAKLNHLQQKIDSLNLSITADDFTLELVKGF